jgi:hypothetical protein
MVKMEGFQEFGLEGEHAKGRRLKKRDREN